MLTQMSAKVTQAGALTEVEQKSAGGKMTFNRTALQAVVDKIKGFVDSNQPFLFGYSYVNPQDNSSHGHAILGCDYYETNNRIYIKLYDENYMVSAADTPIFDFIALQRDANGNVSPLSGYTDSNGNERIVLCRTVADGSFSAVRVLTDIPVYDAARIQQNILAAVPEVAPQTYAAPSTASGVAAAGAAATLTLDDITAYDQAKFRIKPFSDANGFRYADQCGALHSVPALPFQPSTDPFAPVPQDAPAAFAPVPVDAQNVNAPFAHMHDYRYESFHPNDPLRMEIDLKSSGSVGGVDNTPFAGFDIVLSDGDLPGASLLCGEHYAQVSGKNLDYVRFTADAQLREVSAPNGGSDLTLSFGARDDTGLDMFFLSTDSFKSMRVFDEDYDAALYDDCVVLRMNGDASGFSFNFCKGAKQSGDFAVDHIDDPLDSGSDYVWFKIKARELPSGEIGVDIWTVETDHPTDARFEGAPDFTSYIGAAPAPTGGSASSISGGSSAYSGNQYALTGGAGGVMQPDGSVSFTFDAPCDKQTGASVDGTPLQKGADYDVGCGSTIVTLKPAYLATLKQGTHALTVYFTDGMAQTTFTTPLPGLTTSAMPDVPATGGPAYLPLALPALLLGWLWKKKK